MVTREGDTVTFTKQSDDSFNVTCRLDNDTHLFVGNVPDVQAYYDKVRYMTDNPPPTPAEEPE